MLIFCLFYLILISKIFSFLSLGLRRSGNQLSACFTSDGKHIVSAGEDSNVYMWNCIGHEEPAHDQAKTIRSLERFTTNASIAIPWCGLKCGNAEKEPQLHVSDDDSPENLAFAPARFSLGQEYVFESFPKGCATWPEEKLPALSQLSSASALHKSQYKFLKSSCLCTTSSHAWGLVIVTAGWDGRIRSFLNYGLPIPVWSSRHWLYFWRFSIQPHVGNFACRVPTKAEKACGKQMPTEFSSIYIEKGKYRVEASWACAVQIDVLEFRWALLIYLRCTDK